MASIQKLLPHSYKQKLEILVSKHLSINIFICSLITQRRYIFFEEITFRHFLFFETLANLFGNYSIFLDMFFIFHIFFFYVHLTIPYQKYDHPIFFFIYSIIVW